MTCFGTCLDCLAWLLSLASPGRHTAVSPSLTAGRNNNCLSKMLRDQCSVRVLFQSHSELVQHRNAAPLDSGVAHSAHLQAPNRSCSMRFNKVSSNCGSPRLTLHMVTATCPLLGKVHRQPHQMVL